MNLAQTRHLFRTLSGRYDLTDADSGKAADHFINEGSRYLDRASENQKSWASCFRFIEVGHFTASFPYCRAIKEVYAATPTERWQLEKLDLQDMIYDYLANLPSNRDAGTTTYYSPMVTRYVPEDLVAADFEAFVGFADVLAGNAHEYNGIIVAAPPDEKIMVDIKGLFYSAKLEAETDKNYWSEVHPTLIVMSTMRKLEIINKNRATVTSLESAIKEQLVTIGMD